MANIRILTSTVISPQEVWVEFTEKLDQFINSANVEVSTVAIGASNPRILKVKVVDNVLRIITSPLYSYVYYDFVFKSTPSVRFKSRNGKSYIFEDGTNNVVRVYGPQDNDNPIKENLKSYIKDNIYDLGNELNNDILNSQANLISRASYDIKQLKNDNYLTVVVENEKKVRGAGPFDRFNEEGAYELIKATRSIPGKQISDFQKFSSFPSYVITLQATKITNEKLIPGSAAGTFNGIVLNLSKHNITKVSKIRIVYFTGSVLDYDVSSLGYQIRDDRYDPDFASTYLTLEDNQVRLNPFIFDNSGFKVPGAADLIYVDYEYKYLGKIIDPDSVVVSQIKQAVREVVPPITTKFSLQHYPIVSSADVVINIGGVQFLDPQANPPFSAVHPAFTKEIPFRIETPPGVVGEYSIEYSTGTVFVYGAVDNDGTGDYPPTATYWYRKPFTANLDYTYDPDTYELVRSPVRDLEGEEAKISFTYENTLVPGVDFKANVHTEVLNERVQNRITSTGSLSTIEGPITNVFRIYNETTGEVYRIEGFRGNEVFFTAKNPPTISTSKEETVSFTAIVNELLIVQDEMLNVSSVRVFKIYLQNNRIISSSEDAIGSSFNTSAAFSQKDIFIREIYFDSQTSDEATNINRLTIGDYAIDYQNGVVYVGVGVSQNVDVGTISYKKPTISTAFSHINSVQNIYYKIGTFENKKVSYIDFTDTEIFPESFNLSDERFFNNDITDSYVYDNGTIEVEHEVNEVRGIFDHFDLMNSSIPTDFSEGATFEGNVITLNPIALEKMSVVASGPIVLVPSIGSGGEIYSVESVVRVSDNVELWDNSGSFSDYTITLSGTGSPIAGQAVVVRYHLKMTGSATPIIDYSKGDFLVDYQFINDEVLVSYEYGDNGLDFSISTTLNQGDEYWVSYKVGALRDALLNNFGSLVDIPVLNNFDTDLERERYRDALKAALHSFTRGPTIPSLKAMVKNITHIDPELIESIYENWVLNYSFLNADPIDVVGNPRLGTGKFGAGVVLEEDQTISFPAVSSLKLEEGSLEFWVTPEWKGLDNDAELTFTLSKNGNPLSASEIWLGASSIHPTIVNGSFKLKKNEALGTPSALFTDVGCFIYYLDSADAWRISFKDSSASNANYTGTIQSSGEFYNVSKVADINDIVRSSPEKIDFSMHIDGYDAANPDSAFYPTYSIDQINFQSDSTHFLFDFGKNLDKNRISVFKDGSGYLVFSVKDKRGNTRSISKNIQDWKSGSQHHVGISWKLDSADLRDEMHLFVDGFEVPNILKYGGRPLAVAPDKFRTIKPEVLLGTIPDNIVQGDDAQLTSGSNIVVATNTNFTARGISPGATIQFLELGLGNYTVATVSSNQLTLTTPIPVNFSNAKYTVNPFSSVVVSQINFYKNIIVSLIRGSDEIELPGLRADEPGYEISVNALNQDVLTILGDALAGDQVAIRTLGINHRRVRDRQYLYGNTNNILKTQLPAPINLSEVKVFSLTKKLLPIGPGNATFGAGVFTATGIAADTQPSNSTEGRTLAIRVTGQNTNFTTPVSITINGTPTNETVVFSAPGIKNTVNKFRTVSSITAVARPYDSSINSTAIEIQEAYSLNWSEGNNIYPVLRYSTQATSGTTLNGVGDILTDPNSIFLDSDLNQYISITDPVGAAGTYAIFQRIDEHTIQVSPTPPINFTGGSYKLFHVSLGNSGFVNGYFTLERAGSINTPYPLPQGYYNFDYSTYLSIPFDPLTDERIFIGSSLDGKNQSYAAIDEFRILSKKITDVRVGESAPADGESFTLDYNRINPFKKNRDTLTLLHLNEFPLVNDVDRWIISSRDYLQSGYSVNSEFNKALYIEDKPLVIDNAGILSTASEGSIEFWVNSRYDSPNDPNTRYYIDGYSAVVEDILSENLGKIKTSQRINKLISITLSRDNPNFYKDYAPGASIKGDRQTIELSQPLPFQNTPVKVAYVPTGVNGDRISVYKDRYGFITFEVSTGGVSKKVSQYVSWARETWHRIQITYKFNKKNNFDEMRLFVDGEEGGTIKFGMGFKFGEGLVFGQRTPSDSPLTADLNFRDTINLIYIGSDFRGYNTAYARMDNIRFSNISRKPYIIGGQAKDINYNSNTNVVLPVVEDLYTTKIFDFNSLIEKNRDFAILRDEAFGIFNFTVNVIDSYEYVENSARVKQILETLLNILKPATSKVKINYLK